MIQRISVLMVGLLIVAMTLAGCGAGATATPAAAATKEVKIGVVLSLPGISRSTARRSGNAIQLAVDEINAAGTIPG